MARSLGQLTVDLLLRTGQFETDSGRAAKLAEKRAKEIDAAFKKAGTAIGVAIAAGATTAVYAMDRTIDKMDDMSKAAQKASMPTEDFSKFAYAASLADVEMDALVTSLGKLARSQGDALRGTKTQVESFKALGVQFKNADGSLRSTRDVFLDIADAFQRNQGKPEVISAGMQLLGRKFQDLIPLLKDGSAGLKEAGLELERYGGVISTIGGQRAELFNDNLTRMQNLAGGLAIAFAGELLPALIKTEQGVLDWVQAAGGVQAVAHEISDAMSTALDVAETLGVYMGTRYVVSLGLAAQATLATVAATRGLTVAAAALELGLGTLKVAAALLFGPVGLIALGATGLYLLATRQTEAEQAADAHRKAMDLLNGTMHMSLPLAVEQANQLRHTAQQRLADARATLVQLQAQLALDAHNAQMLARGGSTDRGDLAGVNAGLSAQKVENQKALIAELGKEVDQLDVQFRSLAGVNDAVQFLDAYKGAAAAATPPTDKLSKAAKKAAEDFRELMAADKDLYEQFTINAKVPKEASDAWLDMAAQLDGPVAQAEREHTKRLEEIRKTGIAAGVSWDAINAAIAKENALYAQQTPMAQAARQAAEEFQYSWLNAVESVGSAFGDWITGSISSFKDFGRELVNIAKRWGSDLISKGFSRLFNGGFADAGSAGGGGFMNFVSNLFGMGSGGGSAAASTGSWIGTIGRMFGFGGGTAAATAAGTGWGSMASTLLGGAGALAQGGSVFTAAGAASQLGAAGAAGGAGLGAAAGVAWVPIVGWILAGMIASDSAFKQGWNVAGQKNDIAKMWAKTGFLPGMIDSAVIGGADQLLRSLGVSDRWAAILSGSSLMTKALGHQAPKVKQQGIQGTLGFGGFTGQSWADIVAKGGWFRSDKKWTDTAAINPQIDAAFDQLAHQMTSSATDLAKQLGTDVSAALAKVHLTLGKMTLDSDPEKAQAQLQQKLAEMTQDLSAEAVKALGFGNVLDASFQSTDVMAALAASIGLVTGGAEQLGRALDASELTDVARAVKYFENVAKDTGATLADTISRITGTLGDYGQLVGGVRSELLTHDLSAYAQAQLQVELQYRSQVKQANDLAKALGLSGARAEDLASIEQLRAQRMADLQVQMDKQRDDFLGGLRLSDLGIGTDQSKLTDAMAQLQGAVAAGDLQKAQQLAQTTLGFGRNLYASGSDYNALYGSVTDLLGGLDPANAGLADSALQQLADTMDTLPQDIASALFQVLYATQAGLPPPPPTSAPPARDPGAHNPKRDVSPGPRARDDELVGVLAEIADNTRESVRLLGSVKLKANA